MLMEIMFYCLMVTIDCASVSPQTEELEKCVFISTHQFIESQAHKKLQAMNSTQCMTSDSVFGATPCVTNENKNVLVKPECFCAGKPNDQSMECNLSHVTLCCKLDNVVCLNNGTLNKNESDCSDKQKPIYKCKCLPVLDGGGNYQGERCENIPVIRECVYKDIVNDSLSSCDDENDVSRTCIHSVIETPYECGPARQDISGMVFKKCERRYNNTMTVHKEQSSVKLKCNPADNTKFIAAVIVIVLGIIGILAWCWCSNKRNKCRRHGNDSAKLNSNRGQNFPLLNVQGENGVNDQTAEDSETDVYMAEPKRKAFFRRSQSMPAP